MHPQQCPGLPPRTPHTEEFIPQCPFWKTATSSVRPELSSRLWENQLSAEPHPAEGPMERCGCFLKKNAEEKNAFKFTDPYLFHTLLYK